MTIRLGTRGSALAVAQAGTIADALRAGGATVELVVVRTEGDVSKASLASLGGTGVFAGALRTALLQGGCDMIVHSMKDLPVLPADGLRIAAVPARGDARDALCGAPLGALSGGARVGTGSPRRRAQLLAARPDLEVVDIRGNVDTRLARIGADLDAVVLSAAGLGRLGRAGAVAELLPLDSWPTAAAQGALAIELRADEAGAIADAVERLDDPAASAAARAERAVLGALEAGCAAPVGVATAPEGDLTRLWAAVYGADGAGVVTASATAQRSALGAAAADVAAALFAGGAARLAPLGSAA